jgi:hypothetical protein
MAGDSKVPGTVCAGRDADGSVLGFPLDYISGVLTMDKAELNNTLYILAKQGRVQTIQDSRGNWIITLTSWERYQSEYHRQKSYRSNSAEVTSKVTTETPAKLPVEGEVEVEEEEEVEKTFRAWWELYPRKVGKEKAWRLWKQLDTAGRSGAWTGLCLWRQADQWHRDDGKYIPYANTFLAQKRYLDEPWTGAFEGR